MAMTRSNMREVKEQFKALQLPIDEETNEKKTTTKRWNGKMRKKEIESTPNGATKKKLSDRSAESARMTKKAKWIWTAATNLRNGRKKPTIADRKRYSHSVAAT